MGMNDNLAQMAPSTASSRESLVPVPTKPHGVVETGSVPTPPDSAHTAGQELDAQLSGGLKDTPSSSGSPIVGNHGFNWQPIGGWALAHHIPPNKLVENYIIDKFYSDWYYNTVIIIGTCFFSWLVAYLRLGFMALVFVLLCSASVYKAEFRRFNRNIRDDMTRVVASERLETQAETMDWMNSFLAKFWVIYMPALSEMVLAQAADILEDAAPGFGIDKLSLDEFTLGSKAPTVDSIKSYTKKGANLVEMDWAFSFRPMDTDNMTKNEIKGKINPKVALGVRVGKGFVSKNLPILVEDMEFTGRMNVKLNLSNNFPHIKVVSVSFLEAPLINYALKPVGGDTFGLDIMSLIPGLLTFVNTIIHGTLRPMLYAPNSLDIDVEEIMAAQSKDAAGCLAITVEGASDLLCSDLIGSLDPYINIFVEGNVAEVVTTDVKKDTNSPLWNETKYLLLNSLEQSLHFDLMDSNEIRADKPIGSCTHNLREMLQEETLASVSTRVMDGGKLHGSLRYTLRWYPVQTPEVLEDGTKEMAADTEVGILKLTLHEAAKLDTTVSMVGVLNPYAEIRINGEKVRDCRALKRTNEPSWEETVEALVTAKSETSINVVVRDNQGKKDKNPIVAEYKGLLDDVMFALYNGDDWFAMSSGQIRLSAIWKPLSMNGGDASGPSPPVGALRVMVRSAADVLNLEVVGKVDPYVKVSMNGRLKTRTVTIDDCLDPVWNEVVYLPIHTEHQHVALDVYDFQNMTKDRPLGSAAINAADFMSRAPDGSWLAHDGADKVLTSPLTLKHKNRGTISYSVSFVPLMPVYTRAELAVLEREADRQAEREEKEAAAQAEMEELFKAHPLDYEWYEHEEEEEAVGPVKQTLGLDEVTQCPSGILTFDIKGGRSLRLLVFVQFLLDDYRYPSYVSTRLVAKEIPAASGEAFVRDLDHSKFVVRLTKKAEVASEDDVVAEALFDTLDVLQRGANQPITLNVGGNQVEVQFEYLPGGVALPASEMAVDVGRIHLEVLSAEGLKAGDSNGKSDPYVKLFLDNCEVFKSSKVRKTLDPKWNETVTLPIPSRSRSSLLLQVYDWDTLGEDDLLGSALLDLTTLEPLQTVSFSTKLDTQGSVHFKGTFAPEYLRPAVGMVSGVSVDLRGVGKVPLKAAGAALGVAGGVAGTAGNVVGGGASGANDAAHKGMSFIKHTLHVGKKDGSRPVNNVTEPDLVHPAVKAANQLDDPGLESDNESLRPPAPLNSAVNPRTNYANEVQAARGSAPLSPNLKTVQTPRSSFNGHHRTTSAVSNVTSFAASTANGTTAIPGRVTIVSAQGDFGSGAMMVKVELTVDTKKKDLFNTRATKGADNVWKWLESTPFKASPDSTVVFSLKESHKFGKNVDLGSASVDLATVMGNPNEFTLALGSGQLTVMFNYH